jgi:thioesterase domain-containing protein
MNEESLTRRRAALEARRARLPSVQREALERTLAGAGPRAPERPPCVVPLGEGPAPALFLVHPAGGDVTCFAPLARALPGRRVYGLQAPGLAGECEPYSSLSQLSAHLAGAIRAVEPRGPYRLAGWSLGAQVAFEVARHLSRSGEAIAFLGLIDGDPEAGARARASYDAAAFETPLPWLEGIAQYLEQVWGRHVSTEGLEGLGAEAQLAAFAARLGASAGLPGGAPSVAQLSRLVAVYRGNLRALMAYEPQAYVGGATLILGTAEEPWKAGAREGWASLCQGPLTVLETPGDHHTLMASPQVEVLGALLGELLHGTPGGES